MRTRAGVGDPSGDRVDPLDDALAKLARRGVLGTAVPNLADERVIDAGLSAPVALGEVLAEYSRRAGIEVCFQELGEPADAVFAVHRRSSPGRGIARAAAIPRARARS